MGSKSFEQPLEFNGELAYNDPRHIEGAACMYKDGVEIQNLTENDDGVTYINDRGDIFEKDGKFFKLITAAKSPERLAMEENIKRLNPVFSDDYVSELAKDQMNKRARIKIAAEKAAAVEEAKKAERQSKRQNKNGAKK